MTDNYEKFLEAERVLEETNEVFEKTSKAFTKAAINREIAKAVYITASKNKSIITDYPADKLYNAKPDCVHEVETQWSGVKCRKCPGWYCA